MACEPYVIIHMMSTLHHTHVPRFWYVIVHLLKPKHIRNDIHISGGSRICRRRGRQPRKGDTDYWCGYISKNVYVKMKELGPLWGRALGTPPMDPPMYIYCIEDMVITFTCYNNYITYVLLPFIANGKLKCKCFTDNNNQLYWYDIM